MARETAQIGVQAAACDVQEDFAAEVRRNGRVIDRFASADPDEVLGHAVAQAERYAGDPSVSTALIFRTDA